MIEANAAFFWAFMLLSAAAANATPSAAMGASPSGFEMRAATSTLIGATFEITAVARYPETYELSLDLTAQTTGAFTISSVDLTKPRAAGGIKTQEARLRVAAFDLGRQFFPALSWSLSSPSGPPRTLKSPPVPILVYAPSLAEQAEDIRDIKPPLKPILWPIILLATALLAAAGYAAAWLAPRRTTPGSAAAEPVDARAAHEIALASLEELRAGNLPPKPYYERLTDILRAYLERRFGIPALVLTTTDLIRQMRQAEIDRAVVGRAKDILDRSDLVKFAKFSPTPDDMSQDREAAVDIVESTKPPPPADAGSEPAQPHLGEGIRKR